MEKSSKQYTEEFKRQIAGLKASGRRTSDLMREYGLSKTSINIWEKQFTNSGSFRAADNLTEGEKELKLLQKENKQLRMEVDILKQAALILARKDV